jgi:hypothetical protein
MVTVMDLAVQFESVTGIPLQRVLTLLDIRGRRNRHLANRLNRTKVPYRRARTIPLVGDEAVYGRFLSLNYCNHDEEMHLTDYDTRAELQDDILSGSGILNVWTTCFIAFVDGRYSGYEIVHRTSDGGEEVVARHGEASMHLALEHRANCALVWCDA